MDFHVRSVHELDEVTVSLQTPAVANDEQGQTTSDTFDLGPDEDASALHSGWMSMIGLFSASTKMTFADQMC